MGTIHRPTPYEGVALPLSYWTNANNTWQAVQGLNLRQSESKSDALPAELTANMDEGPGYEFRSCPIIAAGFHATSLLGSDALCSGLEGMESRRGFEPLLTG